MDTLECLDTRAEEHDQAGSGDDHALTVAAVKTINAIRVLVRGAYRGAPMCISMDVINARRLQEGCMNAYASCVAGPVCVLILLGGMAIVRGTGPWRVASAVMISRPISGDVVCSLLTMCGAINVGNVGVHQTRTFEATCYYGHGVAVLGCLVLAAAGSFVVLFGLTVGRLLSGVARSSACLQRRAPGRTLL
jgi:hypothetical protein